MRDVAVVGGGIAGLTAAWLLRDHDVLVLEAEDRVGGRIKSFERGDHWISVGAHMFPGEGSFIWNLLRELDLEPARITGSLLGIGYRGRICTGGKAETLPLRLSLTPAARVSLIRSGLRIRRDAARYNRQARRGESETNADVRARLLGFLDDRTWAEYLGALHPQAEEIYRATANRLTAEPNEVAAGCMIALFAHVWSEGGVVLGYNLRKGPSALPEELARRLGERVLTQAAVEEVRRDATGVTMRYRLGEHLEEVRARCAILTAPAHVARRIVADLPPETAHALEAIRYGPFVVGGILTGETSPMPWDGLYSLLTPGRSFNMLFNHANALRKSTGPREPGGALMVYGGAGLARRLLDKTDIEVEAVIVDDLCSLYPEAKGAVREVVVQRWEHAIPFAAPGRSHVQASLERGVDGMIFFAGDYVGEWTHMESAALTAAEAAAAAHARVAAPTAVRA